MTETYISFYLKANRIHVFVDALRGIGSPRRICFLIEGNGQKLVLATHTKRDFVSHKVPQEVYNGAGSMEICSKKLCQLIAQLHHWDTDHSYRVQGFIDEERHIVILDLTRAEVIRH